MTQNIAYSKRNIISIFTKMLFYKGYKAVKEVYKLISKIFDYKYYTFLSISVYPEIDDKNELAEVLNKLIWAIPDDGTTTVSIKVSAMLIKTDLKMLIAPKEQRNYLDRRYSHIKLTLDNNKILMADVILINNVNRLTNFSILFRIHKTMIIDKYFYSATESYVWQILYYNTISHKQRIKLDSLSRINYKNMLSLNARKKQAYCFATGPSFDKYREYNIEKDSLRIICNSIVKNDDFLDYIEKPDILCFADPVFHFGPSEYAARFREQMIKVFEKYSNYIIVPKETVPLLLKNYPILKDYVIGMASKKSFNFPTVKKLWTRHSSNILSFYVLPIASSISDNVYILGADGRKKDEKYFWRHSKKAQFSDLMETAFNVHPSFFRDRLYSEYYSKHCRFLKKLIEYGEKRGKRYYSLTKSFIPVLADRYYKIK